MVKHLRSTSLSLAAAWSALSRFFDWWMKELADLVPKPVSQWWREADRIVLVSFQDARPVFRRPDSAVEEIGATEQHQPEELSRAGGKFRYMLCLAKDQVLQRTLSLPAAVEENLRQTLGFELDRYTPFKPDQAYLDFRVSGRDTEQKKILVDLIVAPRSIVDHGVARASALGIDIAGAVLAEDAARYGSECRNLLPVSARKLQSSRGRLRWRIGLTLLALFLTMALLAIPVWQKRATVISLLAPLAEAKKAATDTDLLRDHLRTLVDEHNLLLDKKWNSHSALRVLDELSKRLPDDTYVIQFDFDGSTIQIQGESASSSSLVENLEASPLFKDVGFKSQLTKIVGTSNDRFHIGAVLESSEKSVAEAPQAPAATFVGPPEAAAATTGPAAAPAGGSAKP